MLNIHDIKPLVSVPDYSIYFYYGGIILAFFICLFILYLFFQYFKNKRHSLEKKYFKILQNLDLNNPKKAAYTISKYGAFLAKEERQRTLLSELNHSLEPYKYKKNIPHSLDTKTKTLYETFLDSIDV